METGWNGVILRNYLNNRCGSDRGTRLQLIKSTRKLMPHRGQVAVDDHVADILAAASERLKKLLLTDAKKSKECYPYSCSKS